MLSLKKNFERLRRIERMRVFCLDVGEEYYEDIPCKLVPFAKNEIETAYLPNQIYMRRFVNDVHGIR